MQCGVACLSMICRFYGRVISLTKIEEFCNPTTEGVSLKGISDAAHNLGFETLSLRLSLLRLKEINLPCILHWNQNHFVVLYKIDCKKNIFHIADPAKGKIKYGLEDFISHWIPNESSQKNDSDSKGIVMVLTPDETFKENINYRIRFSDTVKVIFKYLTEYKKYFIQICVGLLLGCLFQLIIPLLTQSIVDIGIRHKDINFIWLILIGELFTILGATITGFIRRWILLHISMKINVSMLNDFFIKLLKLPMAFFDTKLLGDLLQRMNDHGRIQSFLTNQALGTLFSIFSFIVFGLVLLFYNSLIFLIFFIGSVLYAIWISLFLNQRKVLDYETFEQQAINNNKTYQLITGMQEIKLHGCETRRRHEWEDIQASLFMTQMKSLKLQQKQEAGAVFINEFKNIFITAIAAYSVINGQLTLGGMLAIQFIIGQLNSPIDQLINLIVTFQDVKISLERISEITTAKEEDESNSNDNPPFREMSELSDILNYNGIICRNIDFKYDIHSNKNVINNLDLEIPHGKTTAIVGTSGCGKTTLLKLILGFYPLQDGIISICGKPLSTLNLSQWRNNCGCVMQDGFIFSDSITHNIAASDARVDNNRVIYAATMAGIADFIDNLPLKYRTKIGKDGMGLSKGQQQRILIARAIYRNPDYIFFDEATNSLDAENEKNITLNLKQFFKGKTVVIVAHRLSTVIDADKIVVMENGKITEEGNHDSLIRLKGRYYTLIQNQLELGQ